jgi:predicted short-subunit dehydrogenase-like oxidoreductase (DUF2520 family)
MIRVSIIGSGNVAFHLISALQKADTIELVQICARNKNNLESIVDSEKIVSNVDDLQPVDVCIIAVSDDAISKISDSLPFDNRIVAHTSGSIAMNELSSKNRRAVFYPLQTFSVQKAVDFSSIPICLETETKEDYVILEKVALAISKMTYTIDSQQRKALHVAAVFVNNFVNQLYQVGYEICSENNIPFDILKPLILETAAKLETLTPLQAQTGPAKRKDNNTITSHLEFLKDENKQAIYQLMTQTIQSYEKEL